MATETTIIVEFGDDDGSDSNVIVEIDPENSSNLDEDEETKSTFEPGDNPVILIHHDSNVQIDAVKCTHGAMIKIGSNITQVREETITLTSLEDDENTVTYSNINAYKSLEWYGNTSVLKLENSTITPVSGTYPCHGLLKYNVLFQQQYQLISPELDLDSDETYEIVIVIYASVIGE